MSNPIYGTVPAIGSPYTGLFWGGLFAGVVAPAQSENITLSYSASDTNAGQLLTGLQFSLTADTGGSANVSFTGTMQAYSNGVLVGQSSINTQHPGAPASPAYSAPGDFAMYGGYANLQIVVTLNVVESATAPATDSLLFSAFETGVSQVAAAQTCSIGDYVFLDSNADGIQTTGETGVSGVTVKLLDSTGKYLGVSATTDATGHYSFTNLLAGTYEVQFVAPTGDGFTTANAGSAGSNSVANQTTGISGPITLAAGQTNNTIDAGLIAPLQPVVINAIVFADTNGNGVQDAGETGVSGVTVNLLNAAGAVMATATTNAAGQYSFNEPAGTYVVQVVPPSGSTISVPTNGSGTGGPGSTNYVNPGNGDSPVITLPGGTSATVKAGLYQPVSISGKAFIDQNADGVQQAGDNGISGATVVLWDSAGSLGAPYTVTTLADGTYSFTGLKPGSYTVHFTTPGSDVITAEHVGADTAVDSDINGSGVTNVITLNSGQAATHIDAGYYQTASIGNYVWFDANKNGVQDSNEAGVSGVTVKLLNGNGTSTLATTKTDSAGQYLFSGRAPGVYEVQFVAPSGDTFTTQAALGGTSGTDSNPAVSTGITAPITLTSGQSDQTIDAGLIKATTGPSIQVDKTVDKAVVCSGDNVTFTFKVTNTGTQALTNVKVVDNIGDAANACYQTAAAVTTNCNGYNVGDANRNGLLDVGETWTYSLKVQEVADTQQTWSPGTWTYQSGGCWGGFWSYTQGHYSSTQIDTTSIDTVTATAQAISSTNSGGGGNCGYGYDDYGSRIGYNYSSSDGRGDYFDAKGSCVYSDSDKSGFSKSYEYSGHYDDGHGNTSYGGYSYGGYSYGGYSSYSGPDYDSYGDNAHNTSTNCGYGSFDQYSSHGYGSTGGTSVTPVTVTATDSASVQVLACNSQTTTTGCTSTDDLNKTYGHAEKIEFTYKACDTVSAKTLAAGCGAVTGHNGNSSAFIEVSNCNNPYATGAQILFEGTVANGDKFYADATTDLTNTAVTGANAVFSSACKTYAFVFNSEADFKAGIGPMQTIGYDTTGGHAMYANDQIGSLQVCGYVSTNGHGYLSA